MGKIEKRRIGKKKGSDLGVPPTKSEKRKNKINRNETGKREPTDQTRVEYA